MKFHESLPAVVAVLESAEVPLDEKTLIVRDVKGRLLVAREDISAFPGVSKKLAQALGAYAADPPVLDPGFVDALLRSNDARHATLQTPSGEPKTVRLIDRRVVGNDWLELPQASPNGARRMVFGSLKGGVGRSTALAVCAADLARNGKRVLAIDLDVEAPGIGNMFLRESSDIGEDRRPRFGVVDYLLENSMDGIRDEELYDFIGVCPFEQGSVDVIPSVGRETDSRPYQMLPKLSRALIEDHKNGKTVSVARQVAAMVDRFAVAGNYDAVLIDARAGLAEVSAGPLMALGADLLLFGINQPQTFRGYSYLLSHVASNLAEERAELFSAWRRQVHFVHAKAPSAASKRESFRDAVYELCSNYLYDAEHLNLEGAVDVEKSYFPAPSEVGADVPHDALYVLNNPDYEAFDPLGDATQLDRDVYRGPFGDFLVRVRELLGMERVNQ